MFIVIVTFASDRLKVSSLRDVALRMFDPAGTGVKAVRSPLTAGFAA